MAAEMEESGAALRQLKQAGEQLRALLGEQAELKARGERVEGAKEQRWRALALLRSLKAGLRDTFLQSDEWKARVQEQKDRVEAHQLKLQNLLYEKDHLAREIRRCRGFRWAIMAEFGRGYGRLTGSCGGVRAAPRRWTRLSLKRGICPLPWIRTCTGSTWTSSRASSRPASSALLSTS